MVGRSGVRAWAANDIMQLAVREERLMNDLEALNSTIKAEANMLLCDHGVLKILGGYGKPVITGSYVVNLMTLFIEPGKSVGEWLCGELQRENERRPAEPTGLRRSA